MKKINRKKAGALPVNSELKFKISESYKVLRTNIMFSLLKPGCKKVVISSSQAGEGKTTTAVHIAVAMAQMNLKVVLIDTDLRKPKVNQFFGLDNSPGLTNYLGKLEDVDNIIQKTQYPNLSIISAGIPVPNPSELLSSSTMDSFLHELENQFEYIIMDTPPLNSVADALPLIKQSDGVVLVIREGSSTYPELDKTVKSLNLIDAKILGFVLNRIQVTKKSYYRYGYGNGSYQYDM
ncbi:MAG TPA: CpsD/CapB family tyrosine-protein kinase [Caproiciproducens sp.]|nr:CpsD/CapB family tyrosine-protein kinase [Caproiciproducens sp.]